jgi:hypothetical protein
MSERSRCSISPVLGSISAEEAEDLPPGEGSLLSWLLAAGPFGAPGNLYNEFY